MKNSHSLTIAFLHLPKTGGTTLNHIIRRQYDPDQLFFFGPNTPESLQVFINKSSDEKRHIKLISGHFPFGIHEQMPDETTYITLFREPIKRVVSFFYYVKNTDSHYLNKDVVGKSMGLVAFMEGYTTQMVDNGQTRLISGLWLDPPYGECTTEMFEMAKTNLRERFSIVGLTEQFDETLLLMRDAFNWRDIGYIRQNVNKAKPAYKEISSEEKEAIRHFNQWDIALYEYAQSLFAEQLAGQGPGFMEKVQKFTRRNENPYLITMLRLKHKVQSARRFSIRANIRKFFSSPG